MRLIVFSDLDGTLLDHRDYGYAAAARALDRLRAAGIPLILASSKTAAEILPLHAEMGLDGWPVIVENGAARVFPDDDRRGGEAYERLRTTLDVLPRELRAPFRGFGDMSDTEVAEMTGLPEAGAARARHREFTEPGVWSGTREGEMAFLEALASFGISGRRGGRFLTLSFGGTKAGQMAEVLRDLHRDTSVALGDAPNDIEMIEAADHGIIIRNDAGTGIPPLAGEATSRIRRSAEEGPRGWNTEILALLDRLGLPQKAE